MAFILANAMGLVSAFGILVLIFLVCCCQTEKGCLQPSLGKALLDFLALKTSSSSTSTIKVQEKQQFRDETVKKVETWRGGCLCGEKHLEHLYFCLGTGFLEHFRVGIEGPLWGARF